MANNIPRCSEKVDEGVDEDKSMRLSTNYDCFDCLFAFLTMLYTVRRGITQSINKFGHGLVLQLVLLCTGRTDVN